MSDPPPFRVVRLDEIDPVRPDHWPDDPDPDEVLWHPVRHHLGVRSFGINAFSVRRANGRVVGEHTEDGPQSGGHEELYIVVSGRVEFTLDGDTHVVDAPAFVFVSDPRVRRSAIADSPDAIVIAIGGVPGEPYLPSIWETRYLDDR
jgi:quercetin dioxygenase-like cupin family protein